MRCAARSGRIQPWDEMDIEVDDEQWDIPFFCSKHDELGAREFNRKGNKGI